MFLVAGLSAAPTVEMRPLAGLLLAKTVLLVPAAGSRGAADVEGLAAELLREVVQRQGAGPYTLVARGWGGCVALEMARLLETGAGTGRAERVALMLVDCAPNVVQEAVRGLGQGDALQAWILCSLLHLSAAVSHCPSHCTIDHRRITDPAIRLRSSA